MSAADHEAAIRVRMWLRRFWVWINQGPEEWAEERNER